MPIPTHGFDAPPSSTGSPYPNPIVQEGDPGAVGPGTWWVIPSTGAESIRNAANTGWIATSGSGAIPNIGQVLTMGNDAGGLAIANLADPTNPQDAATKDYVDGVTSGPATTVTGPDAPGASAVVGTGTEYARNDHDHGLPATFPAVVVSPLVGATAGGAAGGSVAFTDAPGTGAGGDGKLDGGTAGRDGGHVIARGGTAGGFSGSAEISAYGGARVTARGNDTGTVEISTQGGGGTVGQVLTADGAGSGGTIYKTLVIRNAAGVPSGAPTIGELPIAADTTASPATLYFWDGAAWVVTL